MGTYAWGGGIPGARAQLTPAAPVPACAALCVREASVWKENQFLLRHLNSTECSNLFEKCKISPVLLHAAAP